MNKELTIVTSFFKINRENWGEYNRSDEQYLEYFKQWAHLKNKIIVYVESHDWKEKILRFRDSIGLLDRTVVEVIPDCLKLEPYIYSRIKQATKNPIQTLYRLKKNNPESKSWDYNYIVFLKPWCVCDAISKGYASGMVCWLDFGYNHGGYPIDSKSDYNYLWQYDFSEKINLFSIQEIDDTPLFDIIMSMDSYIVGGTIVAPDKLWPVYWNLMKEMANCGLADDEQNIILSAYRKSPELFDIHPSKWSMQMKQFGGDHLILSPMPKDYHGIKYVKKFLKFIKKRVMCIKYAYGIYKHMVSKELH